MSVAPAEVDLPRSADNPVTDKPWVTIVWNDPVNLMTYVTYVFQQVFGFPKKKATKLMLDVHHKGKAVVAAGAREAMEHNVEHELGGLLPGVAEDLLEHVSHVGHQVHRVVPYDGDPGPVRYRTVRGPWKIHLSGRHAHTYPPPTSVVFHL